MRSKTDKRILAKTPKEVEKVTRLHANLFVEINKKLNKYDDVVLFPEKVAKAKEMLQKTGLPEAIRRKQ